MIREHTEDAFGPGIEAMSEIFQMVPGVATRERVGRDQWPEIASKSRGFGAAIARDGTFVQGMVRSYLGMLDGEIEFEN